MQWLVEPTEGDAAPCPTVCFVNCPTWCLLVACPGVIGCGIKCRPLCWGVINTPSIS